MTESKRLISAEDLYRFQLVKDARISPDGAHVVYSLHRVDPKTEKKYSNLWVVPAAGGEPRQYTLGDQNDASPRWSPDGKQIAFQTKRDGNWEIYLMNADGTYPLNLTDNPADDQSPYGKPK